MLTQFRKNHILSFFDRWAESPQAPLDAILNQYLRKNKSIGSKDRKEISEKIYLLIRWKELLDNVLKKQKKGLSWPNRLNLILTHSISELQEKYNLPEHAHFGFKKNLFDYLEKALGPEKRNEFCDVCQGRAPIFVRTNLCKTTREALFQGWKNRYDVSLCKNSPSGILFHEKINFFTLPEFKKGLFEVQDEASQLVADLVDAQPGQEVLDYCAGAGGKTLGLAPKMEGKGQIFLYDLRLKALLSAKQRMRRCGVQNAQIVKEEKGLKKLKNRMDWVLLDVPCSGSGTWRRKPDQRDRFNPKMIEGLIQDQREIFESALKYVSPKGKIVYATCSIFPEENQNQVDYFCEKYGLKVVGKSLVTFPEKGKMDGFYAAVISS